GTSFTVVPPLAYLFIHSYLLLALGGAFALIEMLTARMKLRMGFKDKRLLNLLYLALLVVGAFFIPLTLLASVIALISEVIHRREFYQKVVYYGVPTV
ncbi:MAG: 4Fe-4S ferredoxin, partial [Metallosphaera sp.]